VSEYSVEGGKYSIKGGERVAQNQRGTGSGKKIALHFILLLKYVLQVKRALQLYRSAFHPDTGDIQNVFGRMSFQVPNLTYLPFL
jgi:hypothetical protein